MSSWRAVHPSSTLKEPIDDSEGAPVFEFGFWPPRESEDLGPRPKGPVPRDPLSDVWRMVRYGVRGWSGLFDEDGNEVKPVFETVEIDERKHQALSDESLHMLYTSKMLGKLAEKAWAFNVLSAEQKKRSGLRLESRSSTPRTDASDAPTAPPATPTSSSNSTEG